MVNTNLDNAVLFSLEPNSMAEELRRETGVVAGHFDARLFPDGETYVRIKSEVKGKHCILLANLSPPNQKYLPLIFLVDTLKELGALSVGLVAPYLCYMRQDRRFVEGEAITSRIFARHLSAHIDWLVTVDPHLHRYHSLDEIYSIPNRVVQGAPALVSWLEQQSNLLLVGPDAESEQWVSAIANQSSHEFVIGNKKRFGDRDVEVALPDIAKYEGATAVIIDDVISSGQTILKCIEALKQQNINDIQCAAVHGVFSDNSDRNLLKAGLTKLATSNTIPHPSNEINIVPLLVKPIQECLIDIINHDDIPIASEAE